TSELPPHTARYAAPATRAMEIPSNVETQTLTAEGEGGRGGTRIAGSPEDTASTAQRQDKETQAVASPPRPRPTGDAPPASEPAPTVVINQPPTLPPAPPAP